MTTQYQVWHKTSSSWNENTAADLAAFPAGWAHVATVVAQFPDEVFQLTNHIHRNWTENIGVMSHVGRHVRSTSVGDVVRDPSSGILYSVDRLGFSRHLPAPPVSQPAYTSCPECGRTDHRWLPCPCVCHEDPL